MAYLVGSLKLLFAELDSHWPHRDRRTDGWFRNCAFTGGSSSDHCYDAWGRVHAIDIDKDGINPDWVVRQIIRNSLPTNYVIWNRSIYSRAYGWRQRRYNGRNPHTDHVHVSIVHADWARNYSKGWGIAKTSEGIGHAPPPEDEADWDHYGHVLGMGNYFGYLAQRIKGYNAVIRGLRRY